MWPRLYPSVIRSPFPIFNACLFVCLLCQIWIILGRYYISYSNALSMTKLQTLHARREELCLKFALKALKSDQSDWFKLNASTRNTRKSRIYIEPKSKFQNRNVTGKAQSHISPGYSTTHKFPWFLPDSTLLI